MKTLYIAAGNQMNRGYFLGDVITCVKSAWLFAQTEEYDRIILSVCDDPLTFLWDKFIRENPVDVIIDHFRDFDHVYECYDERRRSRRVHGVPFSLYKELYPRLLGGMRQHALCGEERGLGKGSIFEYYYYGQESYIENPPDSHSFGLGVIEAPPHIPDGSVYLAPHEKCQGNRVFTFDFWREVCRKLVAMGITVYVNSPQEFVDGTIAVHPPFPDLMLELSKHSVVISGNTGIGWAAGAGEYPLVSAEADDQIFGEYLFSRCGFKSLRAVVKEPDADLMVAKIVENL